MKNKKAAGGMFWYLIEAALALSVLFVMIYFIYDIFVGKQIAQAGELTEFVAEDCDGDNAAGLNDDCPCNDAEQNLKKGEKCPDGISPPSARENCPQVCGK